MDEKEPIAKKALSSSKIKVERLFKSSLLNSVCSLKTIRKNLLLVRNRLLESDSQIIK
jgi:hypothetical protein